MSEPSPVLAAISLSLRRLDAAVAGAPELDPERQAELEPLIDEACEALERLADELERRA